MNLIAIESCQHSNPRSCSRLSRPGWFFYLKRAAFLVRTKGLKETVRRLRVFLRDLGRHGRAPAEATLRLQPGEWVEVKSRQEILATLDDHSSCHGLIFVDGMDRFCGRRFRVHRRLERMFLEESRQVRRLKDTVLLENAMCDGGEIGCDKSCFLFWREAWLRRVDPPSSEEQHYAVEAREVPL